MKTFTEVLEENMCQFFTDFSRKPHLIGYVLNNSPRAFSSYLHTELAKSEKDESEIVISSKNGPICRFILKAVKKGDSVAFIPDFELLEYGKELMSKDEMKFDYDLIEEVGHNLITNTAFCNCAVTASSGMVFTDGEWKANPIPVNSPDDVNGIAFAEEADACIVMVTYIFTILELLCNNKDVSSDVELPTLPSLGKAKISPVKDGYNVTITFDKEYKAMCKSDTLAEKFASM